tara:strand:- start:10297 stop:11076 length:780 start_codon:yes stop_codon:yes gene_type:complete
MTASTSVDKILADTKGARDEFLSKGYLHIKSVFSEEMCNEAINSIEKFEGNLEKSNTIDFVTETINGKCYTKYFQGAYKLGQPLRKFYSWKLLQIGSILLGEQDVYFADLEAHIRNPGGGEIPRHQDNFYFNLSNSQGMTCYVALSSQDVNTGGLNYLENSHSRVIPHKQSLCPGFSSELSNNEKQEYNSNSIVRSPIFGIGDVSIHHPNNIHFSNPVDPDSPRKFALSVRIFGQDETIDAEGIARYQRLLAKNRAPYA